MDILCHSSSCSRHSRPSYGLLLWSCLFLSTLSASNLVVRVFRFEQCHECRAIIARQPRAVDAEIMFLSVVCETKVRRVSRSRFHAGPVWRSNCRLWSSSRPRAIDRKHTTCQTTCRASSWHLLKIPCRDVTSHSSWWRFDDRFSRLGVEMNLSKRCDTLKPVPQSGGEWERCT